MLLNSWGEIARENWINTESIRDNVRLDVFVVMPNHIHGIIEIVDSKNIVGVYRNTPLRSDSPVNQSEFKSPSETIGAIVRGYKSTVTKQINKIRNSPGEKVWQRNYYDHIIRDKKSLERIRYYIIQNPAQWQEDQNNPINV
ncbi:transposase [Fodinibius saliphilus]|uniref:transposase n=1 Tax=Fodinibius saliphilus TaxID=1920650 RepID=UPI001BB283FD|nr:transposase [Fodinibius saliphilus]